MIRHYYSPQVTGSRKKRPRGEGDGGQGQKVRDTFVGIVRRGTGKNRLAKRVMEHDSS